MASIQAAYNWAITKCNADNTGYSQTYRDEQTVDGVTYYDCSSFIWYALQAGGFTGIGSSAFTTAEMPALLKAAGFTEYENSDAFVWQPCDIGWKTGHTEMCYQGGTHSAVFMGAHSDDLDLVDQVSIRRSARSDFTYCYRLGSGARLNVYVLAAICGNLQQESNINPGIWQGLTQVAWDYQYSSDSPGIGGYGLGQWTNVGTTTGRLYNLHSWLVSNGYAVDSGPGQVAYILHEDVWYSTQEAAGFANLQAFLQSDSTDLEALTHAWNIGWEGIHDSSWDTRVTYAEHYLTLLQEHINDTSATWTARNSYLTQTEMDNNAIAFMITIADGKTIYDPSGGGSDDLIMYGAAREIIRRLILHA